MTTPTPGFRSQFPSLPNGKVVGSYRTYEAAKAAVDRLVAHEGFSVKSISIVGSELKSVERITGRMSIGRAALNGLMSGVMIGVFVSMMWMIVNPITNMLVLGGVMLLSLAFGVVWALIVYAASANKREFTSVMQLTAGSFDVVVAHARAAEASNILRGSARMQDAPEQHASAATQPQQPAAGDAAAALPPATPATPPKTYGEMQDELRRKQEQAEQ